MFDSCDLYRSYKPTPCMHHECLYENNICLYFTTDVFFFHYVCELILKVIDVLTCKFMMCHMTTPQKKMCIKNPLVKFCIYCIPKPLLEMKIHFLKLF